MAGVNIKKTIYFPGLWATVVAVFAIHFDPHLQMPFSVVERNFLVGGTIPRRGKNNKKTTDK